MRQLLFILGLVVLLRVAFLNQPIQGDDVNYLAEAAHAQIEPLHPNHFNFPFQGEMVAMQGNPHPPLNGLYLGAILALSGAVREWVFHLAYIPFSLIAVWAMWLIARQTSTKPVEAVLLFCAVPAFVINGGSLETDVPFLAFWMLSVAAFMRGWTLAAAASMALAAMTAYQAIFLVPVLVVFLWTHNRKWKTGWALLLVAPLTIGLWQLYERSSTGALPAAVLVGFFDKYGLQSMVNKLRNAAALTSHLGWIVFPLLIFFTGKPFMAVAPFLLIAAYFLPDPFFAISAVTGILVLVFTAQSLRKNIFLSAWIFAFFACAIAVFFAGSARYLLPMAAPVILLVANRVPAPILRAGVAIQFALSIALAISNYQHWDGYREFARSLAKETAAKRTWVNGEWGLRHYFEEAGAIPILRGQAIQPGDMVISSKLANPIEFTTGGGVRVALKEMTIRSSVPLRLIGLGSRSAYSDASRGLRPFDFGTNPADIVRAEVVVEVEPAAEYLKMTSAESGQHIVNGIFEMEDKWRWMSGSAVIVLKRPAKRSRLQAVLFIHDAAPGREVTLTLDGKQVAHAKYERPGLYTITSEPIEPAAGRATIGITIDKTFSPPNDRRKLGMILTEVGFRSL